jgi:hypothetical protein
MKSIYLAALFLAFTYLTRVPAKEIERLVLQEVDDLMNSPQRSADVLCLTEYADVANLLIAIDSWRVARNLAFDSN